MWWLWLCMYVHVKRTSTSPMSMMRNACNERQTQLKWHEKKSFVSENNSSVFINKCVRSGKANNLQRHRLNYSAKCKLITSLALLANRRLFYVKFRRLFSTIHNDPQKRRLERKLFVHQFKYWLHIKFPSRMLNIRRINIQTAYTATIDGKHFRNDIVGKVSCGAAARFHTRIPQQPVGTCQK